jgi:hypothetical protein
LGTLGQDMVQKRQDMVQKLDLDERKTQLTELGSQ